MIILGIDPGTIRLGFGVLEKTAGGLRVIDYGCMESSKSLSKQERLLAVHNKIIELIKTHGPDIVSLEKLFFFKNKKTVLSVSEARGTIFSAASLMGVNVAEYTPLQIKQAVTGYGRAEKKQVQKMVQLILKLPAMPEPDDTADALATAICHAGFCKEK